MVKAHVQLGHDYTTLSMASQEDMERMKEFKPNQILLGEFKGATKPRSIEQLNLYWACCGLVAELISAGDTHFTKNDIDFDIKIKVAKEKPAMIKRFKSVDGIVYLEPISIAISNLKHLDACSYFDSAFPALAKMGNIKARGDLKPKDILIMEAKKRMKRFPEKME